MVIKMLTKVTRNIHEQTENWNEKTDSIKMYQVEMTELKNIVTELKIMNEFNRRLDLALPYWPLRKKI